MKFLSSVVLLGIVSICIFVVKFDSKIHRTETELLEMTKNRAYQLQQSFDEDSGSVSASERVPQFPAVISGEGEAIKQLKNIRLSATGALRELPENTSPVLKALILHDYDEVTRLLDNLASVSRTSATPVSAQAPAPRLAQLDHSHFGAGERAGLAALEVEEADRDQLELAVVRVAQGEPLRRALQAANAGGGRGDALKAVAGEGTQLAGDEGLQAGQLDGDGGEVLEADVEDPGAWEYVVNEPLTTYVSDGRLPYEALPQTVETSA